MICAASSADMSGLADCGSGDIHFATSETERSSPEAAARSTRRWVGVPARNVPCRTTTEPTLARTIPAAASVTVVSGPAITTPVFIRSLSFAMGFLMRRRWVSAALPDLINLRVPVRSGRPRHLLREHAPQRAGPGGQARPPLPEHLQRRLIEPGVRLLRGEAASHLLKLVHQLEEPIADIIHQITSQRV